MAQKDQQNELHLESSPYLLQHANNPVHWKAWNEKTLAKARKENKLLLISVGYSACHWCHVMEHESFEDSIVANIMNKYFVSVKVDREERPDIDDVYMAACQLTNKRGCGWPLNAFAMPDGRPFWAGTYFPKERWIEILLYFANMQEKEPEKLENYAKSLTEGIQNLEILGQAEEVAFKEADAKKYLDKVLSNQDLTYGGQSGAPKFPMPGLYEYILQAGHAYDNGLALDAVYTTLDNIAQSGTYDVLGGGFARYATDEAWKIPHFEKMLYDNGQLLSLYAHAYQKSKNPTYKQVIKETVDFLKRELYDEQSGGFYAALDADSEGEEGKYYVWTDEELRQLLDETEYHVLSTKYAITEAGNWEEHKNILHTAGDQSDLPKILGMSKTEIEQILENVERKLFLHRNKRVRPGLDDKVLCSWNALVLNGLLSAYDATGEQSYLELARKNMAFIERELLRDDYGLWRVYKNGKTTINAFLEDYALVIQGFLEMYESTFEPGYLEQARKMTDYVLDHFFDKANNLFFYTSDVDQALVSRKKELSDNVIPSSNAIMCKNLFKLGQVLLRDDYTALSKNMIATINPELEKVYNPSFYYHWLSCHHLMTHPFYEMAIVGNDYQTLGHELRTHYTPNTFLIGAKDEHAFELLEGKSVPHETWIYVCQDKICQRPTNEINVAISQLKH